MHILSCGREKAQAWIARRRRSVTKVAIAGAVLLGTMGVAQAILTLRLSVNGGATWTTITDNGAGDASPLLGHVLFTGSLGNFLVNVESSLSKPLLGGGGVAVMDLSSQNTSFFTGGTLLIQASDDNFAPPFGPPTGTMVHTAQVGGTTQGTVAFTSNVDITNTLFGTAGSTIPLGPESGSQLNPKAFMDSGQDTFAGVAPFAITQTATITHGAGNGVISSFDLETDVYVPEASSLALLVPGLAPLGFALYRRRRARTA